MYLIRRARNRRHQPSSSNEERHNNDQTSFQEDLSVQGTRPELVRMNTLQRNIALQEINNSDDTLIDSVFEGQTDLRFNDEQSNAQAASYNRRHSRTAPTLTRNRGRRDSVLSATDTLVPDMILGQQISDFNSVRALPIVSIRFQRGLYVFPSNEAFERFKEESKDTGIKNLSKVRTAAPLLHLSSPYLTMFKRNSPFLIIYKFNSPSTLLHPEARSAIPTDRLNSVNLQPEPHANSSDVKFFENKFEYCKVYFKQQPQGITSYKLKFQPTGQASHPTNFQVMLYYHPTKPFIDTVFKNTRLRWIGFSPNPHQYTNSFKVIRLNDDSPSLADGITESFNNMHDWDNDEELYPLPNLLNTQRSQTDLFAMLSSMLPIANYNASSTYLLPMKSMAKKGEIRSMDCIDPRRRPGSEANDDFEFIKEHNLVLTCMVMVIRDHELKKAQTSEGRGSYGNNGEKSV